MWKRVPLFLVGLGWGGVVFLSFKWDAKPDPVVLHFDLFLSVPVGEGAVLPP